MPSKTTAYRPGRLAWTGSTNILGKPSLWANLTELTIPDCLRIAWKHRERFPCRGIRILKNFAKSFFYRNGKKSVKSFENDGFHWNVYSPNFSQIIFTQCFFWGSSHLAKWIFFKWKPLVLEMSIKCALLEMRWLGWAQLVWECVYSSPAMPCARDIKEGNY